MNYLAKLKDLRKEKAIAQKDVANALNITQKAYSFYERGEREPNLKMLVDLSNFFNVTIDYLLGQEKEKLYSINDEEYRILKKYKKLNDNHKGKIEERIDILLENQQEEEAKMKETA